MSSLNDKAGILIVANLFKYAVGFAVPMILVRHLTQIEYGTYQLLILVSSAAIPVLTIGLPNSVYYFFGRETGSTIHSLFLQTSTLLAASGMIGGVVIALTGNSIAHLLNSKDLAALLPVYAISIGFLVASEHCMSIMIAQNQYRQSLLFEVGENLLRVALLLAPLALGYGLEGVIAGIVIYSLARFVIRMRFIWQNSGRAPHGWIRSTFIGQQLRYGLPLALMNVLGQFGTFFNKGIIAASFSPRDFAVYSVGALQIPLDSIFQASVANVLRASLPPLARDGRTDEVIRIIRESVRKLSIIVLPSFVFLFSHAREFIQLLFTEKYADSVIIFQIYVWSIPLSMFILSPIPQVYGRPRINLFVGIGYTVSLLSLSYVLLKWLGFCGPAFAVVITEYLSAAAFLIVALRLTGTTVGSLLPLFHIAKVVLASSLAAFAAFFIRRLDLSPLPSFVLSGVAFTFVFFLGAAIVGIFIADDYRLMRHLAGKLVNGFPTRRSK